MAKEKMQTIKQEFINDCIQHLNEYTKRIETSLQLLTEEQVWQKPNEVSNSIANLILHLCGNMTQYVLSSLGSETDNRERDKEFSTQGGLSKEALLQKLVAVIEKISFVIQQQDEDSLLRIRSVQGFSKTGLAIILHVTEHYAYHAGQIALFTKLMTNHDLGFYKEHNLNTKNGV